MAKGTVSVSNEFASFYGKHAVAIEEAKKAENTMSSGPCPVGWKGKCVLLEAAAEKGKDKKDDKGTVQEGNPRVKMKFGIVDDPDYSGKHFTKFWIFYNSKNLDAMGRFSMFLNDCEKMGLPRELRESHQSMDELFNFFTEGEFVFDVECQNDDYANDKKKMVVYKEIDAVDTSTSMSPDAQDTYAPKPSAPEVAEGSKVKFLGEEWDVLGVVDDKLTLHNPKTGRTRDVPASATTPV
jgi:hypothetical protein